MFELKTILSKLSGMRLITLDEAAAVTAKMRGVSLIVEVCSKAMRQS